MTNGINSTNDLLIVDDDEVLRELLPVLLAPHVESVHTAESGEAAIRLLSSLSSGRRPAIILADLQMPGIAAEDLASRLRVLGSPSTKIIAMSGSKPSPVIRRTFDGFLLKPFDADAFATILRSFDADDPHSSPVHDEPLDRGIFAKLLAVMGQAQLTQLYNLLLDDTSARRHRMSVAARALDADTLIREAHAMKGSCGMLGATELHNLAALLEAGGLESALLLNDFPPAIDRLQRILEVQTGEAIGARQEVVQS